MRSDVIGIDVPVVRSPRGFGDSAHFFLNVMNPAMDALNSHRGQRLPPEPWVRTLPTASTR